MGVFKVNISCDMKYKLNGGFSTNENLYPDYFVLQIPNLQFQSSFKPFFNFESVFVSVITITNYQFYMSMNIHVNFNLPLSTKMTNYLE